MGKPTSIITAELDHCYICGRYPTEIHHCLHGSRRPAADKFHLVVGLCKEHHMEVHDRNPKLDRWLESIAQSAFEDTYKDLNFIQIFGKNFKED